MERKKITIDGNEAAAYVAFNLSEVVAIYPITPSSGMGEMSDAWSAQGIKNIWGTVPGVSELQSEGGASGAVHGALQSGSLTTTFTASQGLLLMIPNMYKIAGELTSTVFHVSARSLAAQALSIFGDHSDVMAARQTGFAFLSSGSIQEVMDFAAIAHKSTLEARIPFVHFFDGFRSSHEINKIEQLTKEDLKTLISNKAVLEHRKRGLTPDNPFIRGTAQNPDVYFQGRETVNKFYQECPNIVEKAMEEFATLTGREYHLFDYFGSEDAENIIVMMGSGSEAAEETVEKLIKELGEKVGLVKVRLYRPFSIEHLIKALPKTTKKIAVLDRTKEPGASGEPLYLDVVNAVAENMASEKQKFEKMPRIIGGRYGLSSKEFTPAMVKAVYDELKKSSPKNNFTVGIIDDVTHTSLDVDTSFSTTKNNVFQGMFYGLGADGTVGANKNSIKIIGEETDNYAQGYFVYDSKKSGSSTVSHLRFGPEQIKSTYLIQHAGFVGCHQFTLLETFDVLEKINEGGTFLLNSPYSKDEIWDNLPKNIQESIISKKLNFYVIDAYSVAKKTGMGARINTIMQTCFFYISNILPQDEAIAKIKEAIKKTYSAKGEEIVQKNYVAVDETIANLFKVEYPETVTSKLEKAAIVPDDAPEFVKETLALMMQGKGDEIPVSKMPIDGTFPSATTKWEKRNVALEIPEWDESICIQCGKCALVCPHAAIRIKVYEEEELKNAPSAFKYTGAKGREFSGKKYTIQVAAEDCTGCSLCVDYCPAKDRNDETHKAINMIEQLPVRQQEKENYDFFLKLPIYDRKELNVSTVKGSQLLEPLFEYSGACAGCGETPYVKLVSQLFGDRAIVANATGCSSIYGGNLPTTPWAVDENGRGPAWSNSLFEDNAEFGLGFRLSIDKHTQYAKELLLELSGQIGEDLVKEIIKAKQTDEKEIFLQRERVALLKEKLKNIKSEHAEYLLSVADYLVKKSVWIMGGDGWAYDIGYGGLDHVLASGKNVNVLVLDTEVYSNTGGQMSKSSPIGVVAKFAAGGKPTAKKDLAMMAMTYGNVYVGQIAMGANDAHTVRTILEAESYEGPSLILAYSHCIAHGIDMGKGLQNQKAAVESGHWPLFRFNPDFQKEGKNPLKLDSKAPKITLRDYAYNENRYKMLMKSDPKAAEKLMLFAEDEVIKRWRLYEQISSLDFSEGQK